MRLRVHALALLVTGAALLGALPPVFSQVGDDKLIVPGQRIGKWKLEMTVEALVGLNGPGTALSPLFYPEAHQGAITMRVWPLALAVATRENRVEYLVVSQAFSSLGGGTPTLPDYETERLSLFEEEAAVTAAYGRPTAVTQINIGLRRLTYDEIGLAFRIANNSALSIAVFRPGTARTIWRL